MHTYTIYICIHIRVSIYTYMYTYTYAYAYAILGSPKFVRFKRCPPLIPLSQYCAQAPSRNDHEQIQPVPIPLRTNQIAPSACDQLAGSEKS